ncbi:citrate synthase family protein [Paraburkholderia sp. BL10I2N1]|uniref:citrate/2-methylcitrate synthase n=1 Tax=Paraburkholderia sp. BL10I2N1 TaxID=1938796 RepID=UPI0010DDEAE9|nr:citrate synthase family protein [Paraburkholderia sp. BL10I2N1]TDN70015.1 citrate synthase [Paraburkholderia sp. BL10I2N1]
MAKDLLTRSEVLELLNIKAGTLYAYVSRGLIKTAPHPDGRKSLYFRTDVDRVRSRKRGRPPQIAAAESTMHWGAPVVASAITQIAEAGPSYRTRSAVEMARVGVSFESVAQLLMTGMWQDNFAAWPAIDTPEDVKQMIDHYQASQVATDIGNLLGMVTFALGMRGRGPAEIADGASVPAARLLMQTMAGCLGFLQTSRRFAARQAFESLPAFILRVSGVDASPEALRALNGAMVVLADNELAPATFAARIAASTNADLFNCVAAAIGSHLGFSTGTATLKVESALLQTTSAKDLAQRKSLVKEYGASLFGFNHPMYPGGDPRADVILDLVRALPKLDVDTRNTLAFLDELRAQQQAHPGVAIALVTLARALGMPDGSATAIWVLSRTSGWVAHVLEQRTMGFLLRPRAKYIGSAVLR